MMKGFEKAARLIDEAETIAICGHINPDGDSVGSTLALAYALEDCGKQVTVLRSQDKPFPAYANCLRGADRALFVEEYEQTPDLFISVDVSSLERLHLAYALSQRSGARLAFDHHVGTDVAADVTVCDPSAAACACIIWEFLDYKGWTVTPDIAQAVYLACMTDTGSFRFQNTDSRVMDIAARCIDAGADTYRLSEIVYNSKSLATVRMESRVVYNMRTRVLDGLRIAYSTVSLLDLVETEASEDDVEDAIDVLRSIDGFDVVFILKEHEDKIRVSLRSKGDFNVGAAARDLGGGGHDAAAGCTLAGTLDEARDAVFAALAARL